MIGKHIIQLSKKDLVAVFADYYKVSEKDVILTTFMDTEGYGMQEHQVPCVRAEINISDKEREVI